MGAWAELPACIWFLTQAMRRRPQLLLAVEVFDPSCNFLLLNCADIQKLEIPPDSGFWLLRKHKGGWLPAPVPMGSHLEWFPGCHPYQCRPFLPLLQLTCQTLGDARVGPLVALCYLEVVCPSGTRIESTHTGGIFQLWGRCYCGFCWGFHLPASTPMPRAIRCPESFSHTLSSVCPCPAMPRDACSR